MMAIVERKPRADGVLSGGYWRSFNPATMAGYIRVSELNVPGIFNFVHLVSRSRRRSRTLMVIEGSSRPLVCDEAAFV